MTSLLRCAVLIGLSLFAQSHTYAIDTYWGPCPLPPDPCQGEWGCACDWDPSVPTVDDSAFIDAGPICWVFSSQSVGTLTLGTEGAELWVHSPGTAVTTLTSASGLNNGGTIRLESTGTGGSAWIVIESGALTNLSTGVIELPGGGHVNPRRIYGSVTNEGTITIDSGMTLELRGTEPTFNQDGGTVTVAGAFEQHGGILNYNGGSVDGVLRLENGTINLTASPPAPAPTFAVQGTECVIGTDNPLNSTIWVDSPGTAVTTLTSASGLNNGGTIRLESTGTGGSAWIVIESGALTNLSTGVIELPGGGHVNPRRIYGSVTNEGTITIDSGMTLELFGDLASGTGASLSMQLGETDRALLDVTGSVTLDGTLHIELIDEFEPNVCDTFDLLTFSSGSGEFASVTSSSTSGLAFFPIYTDTGVTLVVGTDASQDCNTNAVPDECDIANGTSLDENGDGIPDECPRSIPAVSTWGMIVLAFLTLTAGTLVFMRRQASMSHRQLEV